MHQLSQQDQHAMLKGPVQERRCTDKLLILVGFALFLAYLQMSVLWFVDGDPRRMYRARDFRGDYCGAKRDEGGYQLRELEDFTKVTYMMEVHRTLDPLAETFLCSETARTVLARISYLSGDEYDKYLQACAAVPTGPSISEATDAMQRLSSGATSNTTALGAANASDYLLEICIADCANYQSTGDLGRLYIHRMAPDKALAYAWLKLVDTTSAAAGHDDDFVNEVKSLFTLKALPEADCPYPARFCVPYPGIEVVQDEETIQCQLQLSRTHTAITSILEGGSADVIRGTSSTSWVDAFVLSMEGIFVTAVSSAVMSMAFLVALRFFTAMIVWFSLVAIALGFVYIGVIMVMREILNPIGGILAFGAALIWVFRVLKYRRDVPRAIMVGRVVIEFVVQNKAFLWVPVLHTLLWALFFVLWVFSTAALASTVPKNPTVVASSEPECSGTWAGAFAWRDTGDWESDGDACSGDRGDTRGMTPSCWRCAPPRLDMDSHITLSIVAFVWFSSALLGFTQLVTAGACGTWFFTEHGSKSRRSKWKDTYWFSLRYHLGSLVLGSFFIALTYPLRILIAVLKELRTLAHRNTIFAILFTIPLLLLKPLFWVYEKFVSFWCPPAYIQVALSGLPFLPSALNAEHLQLGALLRLGSLAFVRFLVSNTTFFFIVVGTVFLGSYILPLMHPEVTDTLAPSALVLSMGILVGEIFSSIIQISVDTSIQCVLLVLELDIDSSKAREFVPNEIWLLFACSPGSRFTSVVDADSLEKARLKGPALTAAVQRFLDATFETRTVPGKHNPIRLKATKVESMSNMRTADAYFRKRLELMQARQGLDHFRVLGTDKCGELTQHRPLELAINEHLFWHGTSEAAAMSIMRDDFRLPKTHTHGGIYGSGVYMAESNSKAHSYCTKDASKGWPLLLVRATLGKVHQTAEKFPDKGTLGSKISRKEFDSVCGDRRKIDNAYGGWREFIVYDVNQVLAEYLVWVQPK